MKQTALLHVVVHKNVDPFAGISMFAIVMDTGHLCKHIHKLHVLLKRQRQAITQAEPPEGNAEKENDLCSSELMVAIPEKFSDNKSKSIQFLHYIFFLVCFNI